MKTLTIYKNPDKIIVCSLSIPLIPLIPLGMNDKLFEKLGQIKTRVRSLILLTSSDVHRVKDPVADSITDQIPNFNGRPNEKNQENQCSGDPRATGEPEFFYNQIPTCTTSNQVTCERGEATTITFLNLLDQLAQD